MKSYVSSINVTNRGFATYMDFKHPWGLHFSDYNYLAGPYLPQGAKSHDGNERYIKDGVVFYCPSETSAEKKKEFERFKTMKTPTNSQFQPDHVYEHQLFVEAMMHISFLLH